MDDLANDGAIAPADDNALFSSAIEGALDTLPEPEPQPIAPQPEPPLAPEPAIPPSRLREEADARRAAERERDELRGRLSAFEQRNQPQPQPQPRPDMFEDPSAFVRGELQPALDPIQQRIAQITETYSRRDAIRDHGQEKVSGAFLALDQAASAGDPEAIAAVARVKQSMDPYGDIVNWHQQRTVLAEVGKDPKAYRERIIEEAMKDPEVQKRFLESTRATAAAAGKTVTRPVVSTLPSLTRVGAAALPDEQDNADDATLFAQATRGKR